MTEKQLLKRLQYQQNRLLDICTNYQTMISCTGIPNLDKTYNIIKIENGENMFASTFMSHAVLMKDGVSHMYANGTNAYGDVQNYIAIISSYGGLYKYVCESYKEEIEKVTNNTMKNK